ncbi:hypothetical protein BIY24_10900 [Halobacteriovorax marinus]|uniref:Lnb N-terminal periplasmic domain-containing protein n=1 Tax=Halobacteriovorax marinus TaxID=97084 RepID=UPI000BC2DD3E|nr:DUF4105 domain-containing protein [Halobacteriovorax marinus]ATH08438.1 hypothetical protein BIY24_10900 [Halobacteriovorax marinus]
MSNYLKAVLLVSLTLFVQTSRGSGLFENKLSQISENIYWKRLLHFNGEESYADSKSFFLSENGKTSLRDELLANIEAFKKVQAKYTPQKIPAQCAFPERFQFIKENFPELDFKSPECPHFKRWKSAVSGKSLSLIFASSFVNNPSSMFGHTFLKFNKKDGDQLSLDMFNYVVAYSAKAEDRPGFLYALKGLFGGYTGIVDVQPFYQTLREYSKVESRDIWEYKLGIKSKQLDSLVNHIWELYANANFDYYFFDENCTSVLARILALVTNFPLDEEMVGYALPTDFLRILKKYKLVEKNLYYPSLRKQFFAHYDKLNDSQKENFKLILDNQDVGGDTKTYQALVHYLDYIRHDHENKVSKEFQIKQKKIYTLASKFTNQEQMNYSKPIPPDEGHLPARLDLLQARENNKEATILTYRPSFHSLSDPAGGYEPWSQIELFKLSLKYNYDMKELLLNEFLIADIQSLPDFKFLDTNTSWSLDLRVAPLYEEAKLNAYKGSFNLNMGFTKHTHNFLFSFLTGARVEGHESFKNKVKVGPNIKVNLGLNILRTRFILESSYFYSFFKNHQGERDYLQSRLELSHSVSKNWDIKMMGIYFTQVGELSKESYKSYSIGLAHFF